MKKRKLKLQTEIEKHGGTTFSSEASRCVHELWPTDHCVRRAFMAVSKKNQKNPQNPKWHKQTSKTSPLKPSVDFLCC